MYLLEDIRTAIIPSRLSSAPLIHFLTHSYTNPLSVECPLPSELSRLGYVRAACNPPLPSCPSFVPTPPLIGFLTHSSTNHSPREYPRPFKMASGKCYSHHYRLGTSWTGSN